MAKELNQADVVAIRGLLEQVKSKVRPTLPPPGSHDAICEPWNSLAGLLDAVAEAEFHLPKAEPDRGGSDPEADDAYQYGGTCS